MTRAAALLVVALALAPVAVASDAHPTLSELENEVMCPACGTTLAESDSDAAKQVERVIREQIAAGKTKGQIKAILVQSYGPSILAAPPKRGFDLLAWLLPLAGIAVAAILLAVAAWRWTRREHEPVSAPAASLNGRARLDAELERRLDDELARFD
jgi:cytochrome c-type biogenesis protein CcmH